MEQRKSKIQRAVVGTSVSAVCALGLALSPLSPAAFADTSGAPAGVVSTSSVSADSLGSGYVPEVQSGSLRVATFDIGLMGSHPQEVAEKLSDPNNTRVQKLAEIIQRVAPDVLILTGIDMDDERNELDAFTTNYLAVGQGGQRGIDYGHIYTGPVNSGVDSGADLDQDGTIGGPGDALGYGEYPGQAGMAVLSQYPIQHDNIRTFNQLPWSEVPDSRLADFTTSNGEPALGHDVMPLSSTGHWDVPLTINSRTLHVLVSAPADPLRSDLDAARNADENRFWVDYVTYDTEETSYIEDDDGVSGGLPDGAPFVITGPLGVDATSPEFADISESITQLTELDEINDPEPNSTRARYSRSKAQVPDVATHTQTFSDFTARTDYILPSQALGLTSAGVYWPSAGEDGADLVGASRMGSGPLGSLHSPKSPSDHRLVWTDIDSAGA